MWWPGNNKVKLWGAVLLVLGLVAVPRHAGAPPPPSPSITLTGGWSRTIGASDLIAGAGSDLSSTYQSAADAVSITISGTAGVGDNWEVEVKKSGAGWPSSFILWVKRTSSGTGGSVSGGTTYQTVTGTSSSFFSGSDDVSGINVQLQLSGVSILPYDTYTTTVTYTLVDTP